MDGMHMVQLNMINKPINLQRQMLVWTMEEESLIMQHSGYGSQVWDSHKIIELDLIWELLEIM